MPPLRSLRREQFCQLLAADPKEDATKAALAAGYAVGSASAVRARPDVQERLLELRREAAERNKVTHDELVEYLRENIRRAFQAVPVMRGGIPTGEWRWDGAVVNKAVELLGRTVGMFTEKHQHDLQGTIRHEHYDARVPLTETERANRLRAILEGSRN